VCRRYLAKLVADSTALLDRPGGLRNSRTSSTPAYSLGVIHRWSWKHWWARTVLARNPVPICAARAAHRGPKIKSFSRRKRRNVRWKKLAGSEVPQIGSDKLHWT